MNRSEYEDFGAICCLYLASNRFTLIEHSSFIGRDIELLPNGLFSISRRQGAPVDPVTISAKTPHFRTITLPPLNRLDALTPQTGAITLEPSPTVKERTVNSPCAHIRSQNL